MNATVHAQESNPQGGAPSLWQRRAVAGAVVISLVALQGCAFQREFKVPDTTPVAPKPLVEAPNMDESTTPAEQSLAVEERDVGSAFLIRPVDPPSDKLPEYLTVTGISATESGLHDALELMLSRWSIGLQIEGGPRALERYGPVSVMNLNGPLHKVMDRLASAMGFFWRFKDGIVTIEPDRLFTVELPPAVNEDTLAGMTNTIQAIGAKDVYLDRLARSLVFRANAKGLDRIDQYLERVKQTRSMIVYEMQIFQVDLNDAARQGIDWNKITGSTLPRPKATSFTTPIPPVTTGQNGVGGVQPGGGGTGAADPATTTPVADLAKAFALTQSGAGLGAVVMGPKFSVDSLVSFLKTQGGVKTVSRPRLAMLNGAKGMLRVGQSTTYVSKVGSNIGTGLSQVTVETRDLRTGLQLSLVGEESDATIYTRVSLSLSELLKFQKFTAIGTDLTLPDVSDRDLETTIRLPAGYSAVLGGITVQRGSSDRAIGVGTNSLATDVKQSELVVIIKPTLIRFTKKSDLAAASASSSARLASVGEAEKPAVVLPLSLPAGDERATAASGVVVTPSLPRATAALPQKALLGAPSAPGGVPAGSAVTAAPGVSVSAAKAAESRDQIAANDAQKRRAAAEMEAMETLRSEAAAMAAAKERAQKELREMAAQISELKAMRARAKADADDIKAAAAKSPESIVETVVSAEAIRTLPSMAARAPDSVGAAPVRPTPALQVGAAEVMRESMPKLSVESVPEGSSARPRADNTGEAVLDQTQKALLGTQQPRAAVPKAAEKATDQSDSPAAFVGQGLRLLGRAIGLSARSADEPKSADLRVGLDQPTRLGAQNAVPADTEQR